MRPAEVIVRWIIAAIAFACASGAHAEPRRVVSLDYCADQFVLALADRAQITALSIGSQRDDSYFRGRARDMRQTRGTLEEVLALRPDLVIRNWGGSWDAEQVYGRFDMCLCCKSVIRPTFTAAGAISSTRRKHSATPNAVSHWQPISTRASHVSRHREAMRPVMYLSGGGAVAGRSTMMDAIISAAGGRNIRTEASWQVLPLERLVQTPPALIALGFFDTSRDRVNAWSPSRHPALRRALNATRAPFTCRPPRSLAKRGTRSTRPRRSPRRSMRIMSRQPPHLDRARRAQHRWRSPPRCISGRRAADIRSRLTRRRTPSSGTFVCRARLTAWLAGAALGL
jgi:iron complex transport system substrate-binding protein